MFVTLDEDTTRFCIEIEIRDDLLIEGAELFGIVLEPSTPNAVVGDGRGSASVSILDNDEGTTIHTHTFCDDVNYSPFVLQR